MTKNAALKRKIRDHAARNGLSYAQARTEVLRAAGQIAGGSRAGDPPTGLGTAVSPDGPGAVDPTGLAGGEQ